MLNIRGDVSSSAIVIILCAFCIAFLDFCATSLLLWPDANALQWSHYGQLQYWTHSAWLILFGLGVHLAVLWLMQHGCLEASPRLHVFFLLAWCVAAILPLLIDSAWVSSLLMLLALLCLCWSLTPDLLRMKTVSLPLCFLISGLFFLGYQLSFEMLDLLWLRAPTWRSWWQGEEMLFLMMSPIFIGVIYALLEHKTKRELKSKIITLHWLTNVLFVIWLTYFNGIAWLAELRLLTGFLLMLGMWTGGLYMLWILYSLRHAWKKDCVLQCLVAAVLLYLFYSTSILLMSWQGTHALLSFSFWQQAIAYSSLAGWPMLVILALSFAFFNIQSSTFSRWFIRLFFLGIIIFQFAAWNAGAIQGIMWRSFGRLADLRYSHLETVQAMPIFHLMQLGAALLFMLACVFVLLHLFCTKPNTGELHD